MTHSQEVFLHKNSTGFRPTNLRPAHSPASLTHPPSPCERWPNGKKCKPLWSPGRVVKSILAQIVKAARNECRVLVICSNIAACQDELTGYGVDWQTGGNVEFKVAPFNSIWIRDYGANPVYLGGVDSLALVDWIYNRPRPKDDTIPSVVGNYFGLPVYSTTVAPYDLVHPGGNNFSDGMGTDFSSKLVLGRERSGQYVGHEQPHRRRGGQHHAPFLRH